MLRVLVLLISLALCVAGATCTRKEATQAPAPGAVKDSSAKAPAAGTEVAVEDDIFLDLDVEPDYEGEPPFKAQFVLEVEDAVPPLKYEWDFGDGSPKSSATNPTHVYQKEGEYLAVVTVTDSRGVSASEDIDIYVEKEE